MKKNYTFILIFVLIPFLHSCELFEDAIDTGVSDDEIARGLKEALDVGISNGVDELVQPNGYFGNQAIKILLPEEVQNTTSTIIQYVPGSDALLDKAVEEMNRAAEDAANEAAPIFKDAITNMTITDARDILFGADSAATNFLRENTYTQLQALYAPKINNSLSKVGLTQTWDQIATPYNNVANSLVGQIAGLNTIPDDLGTYVTGRALDGLFFKVKEEEAKIRQDVAARISNLLQRVFGLLD